MNLINKFTKNLPIFLTAVALAIAVWILAVTTTDPVEKRNYGRPVELEISGLDPIPYRNQRPARTGLDDLKRT